MPHHYNKTKREIAREEAKKIGIEIKEPRVYGPDGHPPTKEELDKRFFVKYPHAKKKKHGDNQAAVLARHGVRFAMQMGSKQKNTPSNFNESAFKMITGDPGDDFFKNIDPMNSLGEDQMNSMEETFNQAYEKAGYGMPELTKAVQSQSTKEGYSELGYGLGKILFPNAQDNKDIRKKGKDLYTAGSTPKKGGYFSQDRVRKRVAKRSAKKASKKFKI